MARAGFLTLRSAEPRVFVVSGIRGKGDPRLVRSCGCQGFDSVYLSTCLVLLEGFQGPQCLGSKRKLSVTAKGVLGEITFGVFCAKACRSEETAQSQSLGVPA